MPSTAPPKESYDPSVQNARIESAMAYLSAAVDILIEAQETEEMSGISWDNETLSKLKHHALFLKAIAQEIKSNIFDIDVSD